MLFMTIETMGGIVPVNGVFCPESSDATSKYDNFFPGFGTEDNNPYGSCYEYSVGDRARGNPK